MPQVDIQGKRKDSEACDIVLCRPGADLRDQFWKVRETVVVQSPGKNRLVLLI